MNEIRKGVENVALFLSLLGNKERKEPSNVCLSCASWEKQFNSRDELYQASDLVIKGKVLSQEPELRCDLVFSRSYVKVECVYKTSSKNVINDAVEIVQTGGTLNDYTTVPIHGAPLLESGNEYLLFLQLSEPDQVFGQYYLISGGTQGIYQPDAISSGDDVTQFLAYKGSIRESDLLRSGVDNNYSGWPSLPIAWSSNYANFCYSGVTYPSAVSQAFTSWNYSEFTYSYTSSMSTQVQIRENVYGDVGWYAKTVAVSNNSGTGLGNAYVSLNHSNMYDLSTFEYKAIVCHEAGHALGIDGHFDGYTAIMQSDASNFMSSYNTPRTFDKTNGLYLLYGSP